MADGLAGKCERKHPQRMTHRHLAKPPHVRVLEKIIVSGTGCWEYQGKIRKDGYGSVSVQVAPNRDSTMLAHRAVYSGLIGPIDGLVICHHCDNPKCVRPDHLFAGSHGDNSADKVAKGRQARGDMLPAARRTHCPHGHPYSGDNVYVRKCGRRMCRTCNNARRKAAHAKARTASGSIPAT